MTCAKVLFLPEMVLLFQLQLQLRMIVWGCHLLIFGIEKDVMLSMRKGFVMLGVVFATLKFLGLEVPMT